MRALRVDFTMLGSRSRAIPKRTCKLLSSGVVEMSETDSLSVSNVARLLVRVVDCLFFVNEMVRRD